MYINPQTTLFLEFERLDVILERRLHSVRVTTCCRVYSHKTVDPYIVEDNNQNALTPTRLTELHRKYYYTTDFVVILTIE